MHYNHIINFLSGRCSPEEAIAVEDWRASDIHNAAFFQELFDAWHTDPSYTNPDIERLWIEFTSRQGIPDHLDSKPKNIRWLFYTSAATIIAAILGYVIWLQVEHKPITYLAQSDSAYFQLSDQSQLWLDQGASVTFKDADDTRSIDMSGSGWVEIKNHEKSLWIYLDDSIMIEDIGTRLDIQQSTAITTIYVSEGRIKVYYRNQTQTAGIGEVVVCDKVRYLLSIVPKFGAFDYRDKNVADIAASLSSYFKREIIISDHLRLQKMTLAGHNLSLEQCLDIINLTFDVHYKTDADGKIYIY